MQETSLLEPAPEKGSIIKNWRKYLFEFVLIFLAVFLGFLAENIHENYGEEQHSIALAKSLYEELKNDSITIASKIEGRHEKEKAITILTDFNKRKCYLNGCSNT